MGNKVKQILSFGLVSILLFTLLAACSSKSETVENTAAPEGTSSTTAPTPVPTTVEPVTLTVIDWYSKNELTPAIEAWNKANPDIQLKEEIVDGNNWQTIYTTRFQSGDAPDLLFMGQTPQWVKNGYLMDISDRPALQKLKESAPTLYKDRELDGKAYLSVIDSGANTNLIYYNQVIFDKLKLSVPKTMEEFYQVCKVIKESGMEPLVFGAGDWADFTILTAAYAIVDANTQGITNWKNALVENKATISQIYGNTFTMLKKLADGGYISKASATLKYDQSVQYFADGKAAMLPQGGWIPTLDAIKQADPAKFKINAFMPPYPADSSGNINLSVYVGYGMAINAKTKYPEQAKKAFDGLASDESIKLMLQGMGSSTLIPGVTLEVDPALKQSTDQINAPNIKQNLGDSDKYIIPSAFSDAVKTAQFNIVVNGNSVEKVIKDLQKEWDNIKDTIKEVK